MFKGSKNVGPGRAHVGHHGARRPEQCLHDRRRDGVLGDGAGAVSAADRSGSKPIGWRRCGSTRTRFVQRARGREGRAPDARRQPAVRPADRDHLRQRVHDASLQAPDDRQHGGSRGGVDRRRARLLPDVLRAGERDGRDRRRLRHGAGEGARRRSTSAACRRRRIRCRATFRRSRRRRRSAASRSARPGRCRRSSSRITSPTTAIPTRIRCTSPRRCCPTGRARASIRRSSTTSRSP